MTERPDSSSGTDTEAEAAPSGSSADATNAESAGADSSETTGETSGEATEAVKKQRPLSRELPVLLVIAVALALLLKAFVVQAFYIPSGSMERTLLIKDRVLVNKLVYRFRDVHRGEIVVFNGSGTNFPQETVVERSGNPVVRFLRSIPQAVGLGRPTESDIIKRVVGVGGDTVACCDAQGRVTVNGVPLDEPYVFDNTPMEIRPFGPVKVPQGELFVMGDHRGDSSDSRFNGPIPTDRVIGRAFVRVWPLSRFGFLRVPDTFSRTHAAAPVALGVVGVPALVMVRRRRRARSTRPVAMLLHR